MTFTDDLGAALRAWRAAPLLPLIFLGIYLSPSVPFTSVWTIATPVVFVFWAGWVGTERIWYLRLFREQDFTAAEALSMTWAFLGRYLLLGLVTSIPSGAIFALGIWAAGGLGRGGARPNEPLVIGASFAAVVLLGVALTFVAPALAFTTKRVRTAFRVGYEMLKGAWPHTAPYALIPPACVAITMHLPELLGSRAWPQRVASAAVGALLTCLFRGAIARYYLRHAYVIEDGAAFVEPPQNEVEDAVVVAGSTPVTQ